jgi:cellulose synthase/poly-beta-1,6-N-acetylglucosamine synthase-like glycosyltransferase
VSSAKEKCEVERVTAYTPAYNVSKYLARTIEGLIAQTYPFDEILVIDDGSQDNSAEIACRYPQVTLIKHLYNKGLAAARNTAMSIARNELVASVDADVVADPNWLATLLPHMADSNVAGAGGFLMEGVQKTLSDRWRRARMAQEWGHHFIRNPRFLYGSNNVFRKSAVLGVGGYNESLRTCGEDPDLATRLRAQGWDLIYDPVARATHLRHDDLQSIMDMYWRWWKFGNQAYPNGVTLRSWVGHALFVHFRYNFLDAAKVDLSQGRLDLLIMDFLALAYMPYRDFRLWIGTERPRKT